MWRELSFGKKSRNGLEERKKDQWTLRRGDFNARTGSLEGGKGEEKRRKQEGKINIK